MAAQQVCENQGYQNKLNFIITNLMVAFGWFFTPTDQYKGVTQKKGIANMALNSDMQQKKCAKFCPHKTGYAMLIIDPPPTRSTSLSKKERNTKYDI